MWYCGGCAGAWFEGEVRRVVEERLGELGKLNGEGKGEETGEGKGICVACKEWKIPVGKRWQFYMCIGCQDAILAPGCRECGYRHSDSSDSS